MMQWALLSYLGLLPLLLLLLLCGDRPDFEGTWVQRLHDFFFAGGCFQSLRDLVRRVCGEKGSNACTSVEIYCCDRPNPFLQLFYLGIVGGCYISFSSTSMQFIPGYYLGEWHRYTGRGAVLFGILLFLMTSFLDPGTITAATLRQHSSVFPFDGVIYEKKDCSTCKIPRPARSKHCSICDRCIARFDHHCGWMNNCIGENNLRYFLGFLIWHVCLCWYGVCLLGAILLGEVEERGVIQAATFYYGASKKAIYPHVLQWLLTFYSAQVLIMIFLAVVSLLLLVFSIYHVYLVVRNTTTNETYKWDDYQRWQAEMAWSRLLAEENEKSAGGNKSIVSRSIGNLFGFLSKGHSALPRKPTPSSFPKDNIYNRGVIANMAEVVFPLSHRTSPSSRFKIE